MSRRPLYRWKSFWLGVIALGFLAWAALRSMTWYDGLSWQHSDAKTLGAIYSSQISGGVRISWDNYDAFGEDGMSHWSEESGFLPFDDYGSRLFPAGLVMEERSVQIAHWVLILLFLIPWAAFLAWRWRRLTRERENERASRILSGD